MKLSFRALTTDVTVDIADDLPHADLAQALLSTYPPPIAQPTLHYELTREHCSCNGEEAFESDEPLDLIPLFELDFYTQIVARAQPGWVLHAAAVEIDGSIIVFAGPSGAGKTTLALELVARGHRVMTEEIVWIDEQSRVCGLSRPLHVVPGEGPHMPPGWQRWPYPLRTLRTQESSLFVPPLTVFRHGIGTLRALVRLTHGPDREPGLTRLAPSAAFQRFWDPTLRPDEHGLAVASAVLKSTPAYRIASRTLAEALVGVEDLLTRN